MSPDLFPEIKQLTRGLRCSLKSINRVASPRTRAHGHFSRSGCRCTWSHQTTHIKYLVLINSWMWLEQTTGGMLTLRCVSLVLWSNQTENDLPFMNNDTLVCWIVSNWNEDHYRIKYDKLLSNFIDVNTYGEHFKHTLNTSAMKNTQKLGTVPAVSSIYHLRIQKMILTEKLLWSWGVYQSSLGLPDMWMRSLSLEMPSSMWMTFLWSMKYVLQKQAYQVVTDLYKWHWDEWVISTTNICLSNGAFWIRVSAK